MKHFLQPSHMNLSKVVNEGRKVVTFSYHIFTTFAVILFSCSDVDFMENKQILYQIHESVSFYLYHMYVV